MLINKNVQTLNLTHSENEKLHVSCIEVLLFKRKNSSLNTLVKEFGLIYYSIPQRKKNSPNLMKSN